MNPIDLLRASIHRRRSRYRAELEDMAPAVRAHWRKHAPREFPGIPTGALFFIRAAEGLMNFFAIAQNAHTAYALPSPAADSVWHAWLRWDADDLARFCRRYFEAPVAHLPHEALDALALPRALVACRHGDGMPAHALQLAQLFRLDARLRMPSGHGYWVVHPNIVYARLNANGRNPHNAKTHSALTLGALLAASLITQTMYDEAVARQANGAHTSAVLVDAGSDSDDRGGAGGDSGGGDSGGCGGGCGGGGD